MHFKNFFSKEFFLYSEAKIPVSTWPAFIKFYVNNKNNNNNIAPFINTRTLLWGGLNTIQTLYDKRARQTQSDNIRRRVEI